MVRLGGGIFHAYIIHQVVNIYSCNARGTVDGMAFETCLGGQIYMLLVIFTFVEISRLPQHNK